MIPGVTVDIDGEAVVVASAGLLSVVSSAVHRGGLVSARAIINLRVPAGETCADPGGTLAAFAGRRGVAEPYVGLLTGAPTERAAVGEEVAHGVSAAAVVTVGLSNRVASGEDPAAVWRPSTINIIAVVDADPEPAALVNAVITATEVKALALGRARILGPDGGAVSGTSTDAVVIAATGRGPRVRFGGPVSELGWAVARAVRVALARGIADWQARNQP